MRFVPVVVGLTLLCVPVLAQQAPESEKTPPRDSGLVEKSGVELVLIDVDVRDSEGNPRRGLPAADFEVRLNGKSLVIESVDELCEHGNASGRARMSSKRRYLTQRYFVLYFDYSQMDDPARELATKEARSWLRKIAQETSLVMVAAFSTGTGVDQLTGFVPPEEASRALGKLKAKRFRDPWPLERRSAVDNCEDYSEACMNAARLDLDHTRRSLRAFLFFLSTIDSLRESKTLLLFHQNLTVEPSMVYGPPRLARILESPTPGPGEEQTIAKDFDFRVGDHWSLLSEVSGTAFVSRTTIYPVYVANNENWKESWSVSFGANLADQTGGTYNRGLSDLRTTMRRANEYRPCTYRLGFRPARLGVNLKSRLRVRVQGEPVLTVNNIRFPDAMDRWERRAQAVLTNPETSRGFPIDATLVPRLNPDGQWGMTATVSFDSRVLEMLPEGERVKGKWEVGVLVVNHRDGKTWEMLGVSEVTSSVKPDEQAYIVHEHPFEVAAHGEYEIRAFIRDKWTNVFGGGKSSLTLPKPRSGAIVAPLTMLGSTDQVRTTLPLRKKKIQATHESVARNTMGPVPLGETSPTPGTRLQVASWACGGKDHPPRVHDATVVGAVKTLRLDAPTLRAAGSCVEATSVFDTDGLEPGDYEYVIRWSLGQETSTNGSTAFQLVASTTDQAPVVP